MIYDRPPSTAADGGIVLRARKIVKNGARPVLPQADSRRRLSLSDALST
jgi:hypothetical protein